MKTTTVLACRESASNLHIDVGQTLGKAQAEGILHLLSSHGDACKRFFIDVRQVTHLDHEAADSLRAALPLSRVSMQRIAFKGRLGFDLAVDGNKVLIMPENAKHVCRGPARTASAPTKRPAQGHAMRQGRRAPRTGRTQQPATTDHNPVQEKEN